jgi:hypothetical protein
MISTPHNKGKGRGIAFLRNLIGRQDDDCVIWPMCRVRGYGVLSVNGVLSKASRLLCEMAHGPAPAPEYEAAHSCGNGHLGCVNPNHLSWKTRNENQSDRRQHGTSGRRGVKKYRRYKLTADDAMKIRSLLGTESVTNIAARFGVHRSTINQIQAGKTWGPEKRVPRLFTPEEVSVVKALRGLKTQREIAALYGVEDAVIWRIQNNQAYVSEPATSVDEQRGEQTRRLDKPPEK